MKRVISVKPSQGRKQAGAMGRQTRRQELASK